MTDERRRARGFSTRAIEAAARPPVVHNPPTSVPIYQSVTFTSPDADTLGAVLNEDVSGFAYARLDHPTGYALGAAFAELHQAEAGFGLASGMAALHATFASLLGAGDRVVAGSALYGTTRHMLADHFGRLGIEAVFVDPTDLDAVRDAVRGGPTRLVHVETIANPTIVVTDIAAIAAIAREADAILTVDNTFASPYLAQPLGLGADLVIESATKWLSGHSDVVAGVVAGSTERIGAIREVEVDTGAMVAPFSAFLVLRGMMTLAVRMERHSAAAAALAAWLERQDGVTRVWHPALATHPQHEVATRQLRLGGGMLAFELAGGRAAGGALIDALTIPARTASLGSVHTMVVHPPSTTHRQLDAAALDQAGIAPGLLRVSVGLEDLEDLQADLGAALIAARAASPSGVVV
jgi:methionine-gamma-lyase